MQLDPARPTAGEIPVQIIGYGEISAVLTFAALPGRVVKRLAGFQSTAEAESTIAVIREYCTILADRGVDVIETECHVIDTPRNGKVVYLVQPAMPPESIGNAILRDGDDAAFRAVLRAILDRIARVYGPNRNGAALEVGMDSQISNWAWLPVDGTHRLVYIDVGAPFLRRDGEEVMDWDVLARAFPAPLTWYFRKFEMDEVIDRYYRVNKVLTDLVGNFIKEGRADRMDAAIEEIAAWAAEGSGAALGATAPDRTAVEKYYDADARIWAYVLGARKMDRFIQRHLLRRRYAHILPGKIKRR